MDYTWNVMPVYGVSTWVIVMLVVIVLLIAALVALSIYGKKLQDRQEDSQKQRLVRESCLLSARTRSLI